MSKIFEALEHARKETQELRIVPERPRTSDSSAELAPNPGSDETCARLG